MSGRWSLQSNEVQMRLPGWPQPSRTSILMKGDIWKQTCTGDGEIGVMGRRRRLRARETGWADDPSQPPKESPDLGFQSQDPERKSSCWEGHSSAGPCQGSPRKQTRGVHPKVHHCVMSQLHLDNITLPLSHQFSQLHGDGRLCHRGDHEAHCT